MRERIGWMRSAAVVVLVLVAFADAPAALGLQKIPASKFEAAETCGCHAEFFETWGESMHAQALTDPIYRIKLAEANKATKGKLGPFCETCHGPVAAMAGLLGKKPSERPRQANEGVNCDFCHQVTGTTKPVGDSSWISAADGVKRAQLKDAVSPYHKTKYSAFHESAEFCGMCHNVNHPANGLALEATYTEWKNGPYAKEGVVCQDCHMTPGPGVKKPNPGRVAPFGVERDHIYTMTFVGGNSALGPRELAEERLQGAADLSLEASEVVAPRSPLKMKAAITNVGAGHFLPTGVTDLRRMWLEVVAVDSAGREIFRKQRIFGTEFADANGDSPVEMWEAVSVAKDDRIAPRATAIEEYQTQMPESGPVRVTAALYYQGVPAELGEKAGLEIPVTEMARSTAVVFPSEEALAASAVREARDEPFAWLLPLLTVAGIAGLLAVVGVAAFIGGRRKS